MHLIKQHILDIPAQKYRFTVKFHFCVVGCLNGWIFCLFTTFYL